MRNDASHTVDPQAQVPCEQRRRGITCAGEYCWTRTQALRSLQAFVSQHRGLMLRKYRVSDDEVVRMTILPFSTTRYGSGCEQSISHLRFIIFHSWIIPAGLCFSKSSQTSSHRFAMSTASRRFLNSNGPFVSTSAIVLGGFRWCAKKLPNPTTFRQFQPPQCPSSAECRAPPPISRVETAAGLV